MLDCSLRMKLGRLFRELEPARASRKNIKAAEETLLSSSSQRASASE